LKPPLSVFIRVHLCLKIPSPKIRIPDLSSAQTIFRHRTHRSPHFH
jgi:hypothetical protein